MSINLNEIREEYAKLPFVPLDAFFTKWSSENVWQPFNTSVSAFHFPLNGKAEFNMNGNSYPFLPGKVIHGAPDKWLKTRVDAGLSCEFFTLYYIYEGNDADHIHSPYELEIGVNPQLISMLWQIVKLRENWCAQSWLQAKALVYSILSEIFSSAQSIQQINANGVVEDTKAYVERHYTEPHTLSELSGRYGMEGKYFSYVFKLHTGIGPIDYLIAYRLEQARKLLESTECSIQEIGKSVGYKDALYFSRQFRQHFGLSPSNCRNQFRHDV